MILSAVGIILVLVAIVILIASQRTVQKAVEAQRESAESFCRFADMVLFRLSVLEQASKNALGEEALDEARREVRIDRGGTRYN